MKTTQLLVGGIAVLTTMALAPVAEARPTAMPTPARSAALMKASRSVLNLRSPMLVRASGNALPSRARLTEAYRQLRSSSPAKKVAAPADRRNGTGPGPMMHPASMLGMSIPIVGI